MKTLTYGSEGGNNSLVRKGIILLLVAFVIIAFAYSIVNPHHEATDELRHYRFVRTLVTTRKLPVQGVEPCRSQSHHPPLYYAIGALATFWIDTGRDLCYTPPENPFWAYRYWEVGTDNKNQYLHGPDEDFPWSGEALAVRLLRGINVFLGALVVWLTWGTGRIIWPERPSLALGAAAVVAFNPMFLYMSASINNDVIAAASGSAILFACMYLLHDPSGLRLRWALILGTLYGLALLSKSNLAIAIVFIELVISWAAWKNKQGWQWLLVNLGIAVLAGLIAGWWFVRNISLYGDLTGFSAVAELWGVRDPTQSFGLAVSELPYAWTTLWGRFGFGQIPLPNTLYVVLLIFSIIAFVGAVIGFLRENSRLVRTSLLLLATYVVLFFAVLFGYMLVSPAGPNGRFFFPALSAFALLIFFGLLQWLKEIRRAVNRKRSRADTTKLKTADEGPATRFAALILIAGMLVLSLYALFGYLAPAYAIPPTIAEGAVIPNQANASFDSLVTLLGYEISADEVKPGEPIDIDLYWEVNAQPPGNYLLFVHLKNDEGAIIAQRDTHPGLGNFPSSLWKAGDRFKDSIRLFLPETTYAPANAKLSIGLYDPTAYRLAVADAAGKSLGDSFQLAKISIAPSEGEYPNHQQQNFSDQLQLVGYEYSRLEAGPGDEIGVDLYWEALTDISDDYIVQVRLLDGDGRIWADADHRPVEEGAPTSSWMRGDIIHDLHVLELPSDTPEGSYIVDIALLNSATGERQNIIAYDGHWIDSHLALAPIKIHP